MEKGEERRIRLVKKQVEGTTYTSKGQLGEKVDQLFFPTRTGSKIWAKEGEPLEKKRDLWGYDGLFLLLSD